MGFNEYQKSDNAMCMNNDCNRKIYEAGAASRQGEIDELKSELEILQGMHNAASLYAGQLVDERDELQKRIDDVLDKLSKDYYTETIDECVDILKGKKDE